MRTHPMSCIFFCWNVQEWEIIGALCLSYTVFTLWDFHALHSAQIPWTDPDIQQDTNLVLTAHLLCGLGQEQGFALPNQQHWKTWMLFQCEVWCLVSIVEKKAKLITAQFLFANSNTSRLKYCPSICLHPGVLLIWDMFIVDLLYSEASWFKAVVPKLGGRVELWGFGVGGPAHFTDWLAEQKAGMLPR